MYAKISLLQLHSTPKLPVLTPPLRYSRYNDASTFHFLGFATCSTYLIRPVWIAVVKMCNNKVTKPLVKQFPSSSRYFSLCNVQILCAATTFRNSRYFVPHVSATDFRHTPNLFSGSILSR
jgi:hypothetical protein